jgi:hypothetical protein
LFRGIGAGLALIAVGAFSSTALAQSVQGRSNGGHETRSYTPGQGAKLLQAFWFRYTSKDHHIRAIKIRPDQPSYGKIQFQFSDHNNDDDYDYHIRHTGYYGPIFRRTTYLVADKGSATRTIARPTNMNDPVFVLKGFNIYYHGDDHHLDQLKIIERNGKLTVAFNDRNDDDTFWWQVEYAYVPRATFRAVGAVSGYAKEAKRRYITPGSAVIRGFDFNFTSDDHHIKEVGIFPQGNGYLDLFYGDSGGEDYFYYRVEYAVKS